MYQVPWEYRTARDIVQYQEVRGTEVLGSLEGQNFLEKKSQCTTRNVSYAKHM